jgi:hypothetical protein
MTEYPLPPRREIPKPSEDELQQEISALEKSGDFMTSGLIPEYKDRMLRFFAIANWRNKQRHENPGAFYSDYPPEN